MPISVEPVRGMLTINGPPQRPSAASRSSVPAGSSTGSAAGQTSRASSVIRLALVTAWRICFPRRPVLRAGPLGSMTTRDASTQTS